MKNYQAEYDKLHINYPVKERNKEAEWWYFDADLDNGDRLVLMYSVNDTRLYPRKPSVRFDLYEKNGQNHSFINEYVEEDAAFSREKCAANFANQEWCRDCGDYYEVRARANGYEVDLCFYSQVPGWQAGKEGRLMYNPQTGDEKAWVVAQPAARVEGKLVKNQKTITVKGTGYHDHNWMNMDNGDMLDHWHWGKVHTSELAVDYGIMIPATPNVAPAITLLVEDRDHLYLEPGDEHHRKGEVSFELLDTAKEPTLGLSFAQRLVIHAKTPEIKLDLDIKVDHFVMKDLNDLPTGGESAYRYVGNETLTVKRHGQEEVDATHSLHEVVFPHKANE
ncbi:lipocalin-like domain-containing protein [Limosilactobacillus kribbianus]|uniref:lipocalin-like domain-containing protein n=1 Tax=Limosilactobacillus kribbianus TaxID=2982695 RepID=UPI002264F5A9|nr:lipocalin-like domain-containing protein [Limosilactobacillus kribbianus]